ncbi:hypothetical protein TNCV_2281181 [Trichonephila clavipes]|nr:hypothetical protein TNCV_2281181 [Trichonephila clavipes]
MHVLSAKMEGRISRYSLQGCGSPVVKVSDHGRHVMSSSPVPLRTRRERKLKCRPHPLTVQGMRMRFKMTSPVAKSLRVAEQFDVSIHPLKSSLQGKVEAYVQDEEALTQLSCREDTLEVRRRKSE